MAGPAAAADQAPGHGQGQDWQPQGQDHAAASERALRFLLEAGGLEPSAPTPAKADGQARGMKRGREDEAGAR